MVVWGAKLGVPLNPKLRLKLVIYGTVCLGSTNFLCFGQRLKHVNLLEMTNFFDPSFLFWSLRPENMIKCVTQSALGQIRMGKWHVPTGGIIFLRLQKGPRRSDFSGALFAANAVPEKMSTNGRGGGGEIK